MPGLILTDDIDYRLDKLRRAAFAARRNNLVVNGTMASPPTVTVDSGGALAVAYQMASAGTLINQDKILIEGGIGVASLTAYLAIKSVSCGASSGNISVPGSLQSLVAVEIETDSPNVKYALYKVAAAGYVRYAVSEDRGPMQYIGGPSQLYTGNNYGGSKLAFGASKIRRVRLEIGGNTGESGDPAAILNNISVDQGYSIWKPNSAADIQVAVCGDSYSKGGPTDGWGWQSAPAQLSQMLGWRYNSLALGGTGYSQANSTHPAMKDRLSDLSARSFDAVIFALGHNDRLYYATTLQADALACWRAARAAQPSVPIIIFGGWSAPDLTGTEKTGINTALTAAFAAFADPNAYYIPISADPSGDWMAGTTNIGAPGAGDISGRYISADNTHPVTAGANYLAARMYSGICKALAI